jgi:hypothetical protein
VVKKYFRRTDGQTDRRTDRHHDGSIVSSIIYMIITNNLNIIHEELEPTLPLPLPLTLTLTLTHSLILREKKLDQTAVLTKPSQFRDQ